MPLYCVMNFLKYIFIFFITVVITIFPPLEMILILDFDELNLKRTICGAEKKNTFTSSTVRHKMHVKF